MGFFTKRIITLAPLAIGGILAIFFLKNVATKGFQTAGSEFGSGLSNLFGGVGTGFGSLGGGGNFCLLRPPLKNWKWINKNTFPNGFLVFVLGRWARQKGGPALAAGWLAGPGAGRRPGRFVQAYI